jgi:hypothetical protein
MTPAGVDHDFNFLTAIERDIEKAENGIDTHGLSAPARTESWSQSAQKGAVNYQHLESSTFGLTVLRAPKGFSRQRENKSHRSSTKLDALAARITTIANTALGSLPAAKM